MLFVNYETAAMEDFLDDFEHSRNAESSQRTFSCVDRRANLQCARPQYGPLVAYFSDSPSEASVNKEIIHSAACDSGAD